MEDVGGSGGQEHTNPPNVKLHTCTERWVSKRVGGGTPKLYSIMHLRTD